MGLIQQELNPDQRRAAYGCDVTYVTNSELGFDYLRDNLAAVRSVAREVWRGKWVQWGAHEGSRGGDRRRLRAGRDLRGDLAVTCRSARGVC